MLGVLGGMGPLATADFIQKLVKATPAKSDQDHPEVIVFSNPKIPDRVGPILGRSAVSPLPALIDTAQRLQAFGAKVLVMPCHTAHYWHTQIAQAVTVPFVHIADAACEEILGVEDGRKKTIGVLATEATLHAEIYQDRFKSFGISYLVPEQQEMQRYVLPAIAAVKRVAMPEASKLLTEVVNLMTQRGAEVVVLACTELPTVLDLVDPTIHARCMDVTEILARASISALAKL